MTPNFIEIQKLLSEIQNAKPETQEDVDALNKKIEKLNSLIGVDEEEEKGETAKEGEDTEAAEEESFETQSNHFQKYYDILTKIGDQKVEKEGVYDGFAYFQDGGIDLTKLTYYNQGQSADENYAYKWTKVNDEFAFVLTSDFTVEDHKVLTKEGANVKLEAGKYSIEGTVSAKTEDWGNLKNINTDPQSAYIAETFGKQTVATYNGVTFDKEKVLAAEISLIQKEFYID